MAAFVSGEETSCEMVADGADTWTLDAIGYMTSRSRAESHLSSSAFAQRGKQQNRQLTKRGRVTSTVTAQWGRRESQLERQAPSSGALRVGLADLLGSRTSLDPYLGNIV